MPPEPSPPFAEVPHNPRWILLARISAVTSFLFLVLLFLTGSSPPFSLENFLFLLPLFPFWLPYVWMFFRLGGKTVRSVKIGLAMAVTCGLSGALITLFFASLSSISHFDWIVLVGTVFFVAQISLLVSGIFAYYSMQRVTGDFSILFRRFVLFTIMFLLIVIASVMIPSSLRSKVAADESVAVASLRTINTAQMDYAKNHPQKGFSTSLAEFGPPPGMDYIDAALAGGAKSGYVFVLVPGAPDSRGCIVKYTLTARPLTYGSSGKRSFFTDQSSVIHYTADNRPATATDPTLQ